MKQGATRFHSLGDWLVAVPLAYAILYGVAQLGGRLDLNPWVTIAASTGSAAAILLVGPSLAARRSAKRHQQLVARTRGGSCHVCGYDLAGLPAPVRCPECGTYHLPPPV